MPPETKDFFREATLRICGSLDIVKAFHSAFLYIRDFIPADMMTLVVLDLQTGSVENITTVTPEDHIRVPVHLPVPLEIQKLIKARLDGQPVKFVNRIADDRVFGPISRHFGWRLKSLMVMRLVLEGKILGGVIIGNRSGKPYSEEHNLFLSSLNEPFAIALSNFLQHRELQRIKDHLSDENRYLQEEMQRLTGDEIIGADFGLKKVMEQVWQVAPLDTPVLLLGETGVGKEIIAIAIHRASPRRNGPFIKVNCGAIPETLIDSELFGHERGAFTGAFEQRYGRFERAKGGSLFLDEVAELPLNAQTRLLRVLQEKVIERVGGKDQIKINIRIIAATHRKLEKMIKDGLFREDLFFRLHVFPISIPALRDRRMDIPALVYHLISKKSKEIGMIDVPKPTPGALEAMMKHNWPGNIRELENTIERALILHKSGPLTFDGLMAAEPHHKNHEDQSQANTPFDLDLVMARHIMRVLAKTNGRIEGEKGAARLLNIHPSTLRKRMRKLGIPFSRKTKGNEYEPGATREQ
jgi:transcriptional regulator with GAF, ATPase, and Fis domain